MPNLSTSNLIWHIIIYTSTILCNKDANVNAYYQGLVYVAEIKNHCVQILNPDLKFYKNFGSKGKDNG